MIVLAALLMGLAIVFGYTVVGQVVYSNTFTRHLEGCYRCSDTRSNFHPECPEYDKAFTLSLFWPVALFVGAARATSNAIVSRQRQSGTARESRAVRKARNDFEIAQLRRDEAKSLAESLQHQAQITKLQREANPLTIKE